MCLWWVTCRMLKFSQQITLSNKTLHITCFLLGAVQFRYRPLMLQASISMMISSNTNAGYSLPLRSKIMRTLQKLSLSDQPIYKESSFLRHSSTDSSFSVVYSPNKNIYCIVVIHSYIRTWYVYLLQIWQVNRRQHELMIITFFENFILIHKLNIQI